MADTDTQARIEAAVDISRARPRRQAALARRGRRAPKPASVFQYTLLLTVLALMFVPIVLMISMSLRRTALIYTDFWGLPFPPFWKNYAVTLLELTLPLARTLWLYIMSITGMLLFASLAAFAFARIRLMGYEALFYTMVLLVMMIPGVITLSPSFVLMARLRLKGSLWGLAVSYIAGGQPFCIFLLTTFFKSQPVEMFESARVDGANNWQSMWQIAMPLARPILVTLAIMNFLSIYGDLIWPSLMLRRESQTMILALMEYNPRITKQLTSRPELGAMTAGYVFGSIPPLIIFIVGMRYYIAGLTSGAIKG